MVNLKENELVKYEFLSKALKGFSVRSITISKLLLLVFTTTLTGGFFLENTIPGLLSPAKAQLGIFRQVSRGVKVATIPVATGERWGRRVPVSSRNLAFLCEHIGYGAYIPRIHTNKGIIPLNQFRITGANGSQSSPFNIPQGVYFIDFVEDGTSKVVDEIWLDVL